jgi:hypothetical protein
MGIWGAGDRRLGCHHRARNGNLLLADLIFIVARRLFSCRGRALSGKQIGSIQSSLRPISVRGRADGSLHRPVGPQAGAACASSESKMAGLLCVGDVTSCGQLRVALGSGFVHLAGRTHPVSRVRGIRSRTNKVPPNKAVGWRCRTTAQCHQTVADRWAIARDRRSFAEGRRSGKPLERVPIGKSWLRLDLNEAHRTFGHWKGEHDHRASD